MLADRWRAGPRLAIAPGDGTVVVANADDPLVVWAARTAPRTCGGWGPAGAGALDAVGCPACGGRIDFDPAEPSWALRHAAGSPGRIRFAAAGGRRTWSWLADGRASPGHRPPRPVQPGQRGDGGGGRRRHAGRAGHVAVALAEAMARVVRPRWRAGSPRCTVDGRAARLLLAKNPAGWTSSSTCSTSGPATPGGAVGSTPGWPTASTPLAVGRALRAAGRRRGGGHRGALPRPGGAAALRRGAPHRRWRTRWTAVDRRPSAGRPATGRRRPVDFLGNYTAFADLPGAGCDGRASATDGAWSSTPTSSAPTATAGNGLVLARRASWRGIDAELVQAPSDRPLPAATSTAWAAARTARRCGRPTRCCRTARSPGRVDGRRRGAGGVCRVPDRRAARSPTPTAGRTTGSGCST